MAEQLRTSQPDAKRLRNPARVLIEGWRTIKRRDQLGQISYVNTRIRKDYTNCDGEVKEDNDYAIYAEKLESGGGMRRIEYARRDERGRLGMRRVTILNEESSKIPSDIEHIVVDDSVFGSGEQATCIYDSAKSLRSQADFPFDQLEEELTAIYKDAKPHLWPGDPFWL
jgi:hypothetical protein